MLRTLLLALCLSVHAQADEGMWTLNNFPTQSVEKKYNFKATDQWLEHVRLSSARLAGGCSASFVSSEGLVMTNHHCAHSCIEQLSTAKKDYVASGFYAQTYRDEVKCPEIEVNRLVQISDITKEVNAATKGLKDKAFNDAQKAVMSKLEKQCAGDDANLRCDVVTLYHGGQYNLYKYQRYQDVRLVFAPEFAIAFFGGDPDNFNFPRYDLDVSFLRVYDKGKPLQNQEYFRWSDAGAKDGELTFVTGHPGRTSRLLTVSELEYARDITFPDDLVYLAELRGMLTEFQKRGPEQHRIANAKLFGVENSFKAITGRFHALVDKKLFSQKVEAEKNLRKKINANPKWKSEYGSAWDEIAKAEEENKKIGDTYDYIESTSYGSRLYGIAKSLVRAAAELPKPNETRFREFADSKLPGLKQNLFSTAPIYDDLEIAMMTFSLTKAREHLTADHPFIKKIFGKKSPEEIAKDLITHTKLKDVKYREQLFNGGQKAILESTDPMILFALSIDPDARSVRKQFEDNIEPIIKKNSEKIAQANFAVFGTKTYPDATFTLRISYGQVKGFPTESGQFVPPFTNFAGAFERHTGSEPFALPESWLTAKSKLNGETPFDFCTNNDIIGGNSGSPMINKNAEIVGLIFDGNIYSLGGEFGFNDTNNRAVAVHSSALLEALDKVYGAKRIVDEIKKK